LHNQAPAQEALVKAFRAIKLARIYRGIARRTQRPNCRSAFVSVENRAPQERLIPSSRFGKTLVAKGHARSIATS
jgi:hypothetical protein